MGVGHVVGHAHGQFGAVGRAFGTGGKNLVTSAAQMREARTNRALIIHMGANGHQSLQAQSAHRTDALGQVDGVLVRSRTSIPRRIRSPPATRDRDAAHGGTAGDLFRQFDGIHGFDGVHYRQHLADFIGLQLADEIGKEYALQLRHWPLSAFSGINHA